MSARRLLLAVGVLAVSAPAAHCGQGLFFDVLPTVINDRAMVPLRPIAEWLGATVTYRDGRIVATKGEGSTIRVELTLGSSKARIANRDFVLGAPAQSIRGRVMVPLRFVAEG
ncbi:MAG: copper amine oxidase N-terminal domain-containing protein, partial [Armatimonadota bacterium]